MTHKTLVNIRRRVARTSAGLGLVMSAVFISAEAFSACSYSVTSEWSSGFNANIRITNTTDVAIQNWSVQWQYNSNNRVANTWDAILAGSNPYTASNQSWNGVIQPNQYVDIGLQGTKPSGATEIPMLSGSACEAIELDHVYLQVDKADDYLFVYVDGVEKMRWSAPRSARNNEGAAPARIGEKIDITHLLAAGDNDIKIVAAADNWYSLTGGYDVRLWQGNNLLIDARQDFAISSNAPGILFSDSVTVEVENADPRRTLTLNSINGGEAIYLNGVFTGEYVPATFELASGEYRVGLGESTSVADWANNTAVFTGQFRELDILVSDQNITLNAAQLPVLDEPKEWKVAVVPYREVHFGLTDAQANAGVAAAANNIGIMTNDDIEVAVAAVQATSDEWLLPLSYGLMKWDVTLLPTVTERVYRTDSLHWNTAMINADLSVYDMVIHVMPDRTLAVNNNGQRIPVIDGIGGAANRPYAYMPQSWLTAEGATLAERLQNVLPSTGMLHESLHTYDNYRLNDYNGVEQLHGAGVHGYTIKDCGLPSDWLCWYRGYIRSQIGENASILSGVESPVKISGEDVTQYVGVFHVMRGGRSAEQLWSYNKPFSRIRNNNSQSCLDVAWSETADGAAILPWSCHGDMNQQWSLREVQNSGAYHLVNQNSGKCADISSGSMLQQACGVRLAQRFILGSSSNSGFQIKSLSGQCLTHSSNNSLAMENCSESAPRQRWQFD